MKHLRFPYAPKRVAQKFHFAILRIEVTRASRGLSAIAELLVKYNTETENSQQIFTARLSYASVVLGVVILPVSLSVTRVLCN